MKFAVQGNRVPGKALADRIALAEDMGFEGAAIWGADIAERIREINNAARGRTIRPCTICAGYMAFECGISNPSNQEGCLRKSVEYLRNCL